MSELAISPYTDRELFSLHEEEDVTEVTLHRQQVVYFETALRNELPDRFVGANLGVYWVPGQLSEPWAGPDLLVAARPPLRHSKPRIWLVWEDGPLQFVAEVASEKTRHLEPTKRVEIYQDALAVPEYLYVDLDRHQLELWRLRSGVYQPVRAQRGRFQSQELGVGFGWEPRSSLVRIWDAAGRMLPTPEEQHARLLEAEERAFEEQRRRQEAEQARREEQRLRLEAEARAAALAAELERLRRGDA